MKLTVHASVFTILFTGFMASTFTAQPTESLRESTRASHSLVISSAMPVPNCPPDTGCPFMADFRY